MEAFSTLTGDALTWWLRANAPARVSKGVKRLNPNNYATRRRRWLVLYVAPTPRARRHLYNYGNGYF